MDDKKVMLEKEEQELDAKQSTEEGTPRREFIKKASLAVLGGISLPIISANRLRAQNDDDEKPTDEKETSGDEATEKKAETKAETTKEASAEGMKMRTLGKVGQVSELTFGGHIITDVKVLEAAIAMGFNLFDTAPVYYGGQSEEAIGEYLKKNKDKRSKLIISTKLPIETDDAQFQGNAEKMMASLDKSLKRMNTDYVDIISIQGVGGEHRVTNPELHSFFEKAKKAGKAKHLGLTSYYGDMKRVVNKAIDLGSFDVIQLYYNFVRATDQHESRFFDYKTLFSRAKSKKIGIMVSDPFAGGFDVTNPNFKDKDFRGAAIRWLLQNKSIDTVRIPIRNFQELETYGSAAKKAFSSTDQKILDAYKSVVSKKGDHHYCRACNVCIPVCIFNVAIEDIFRYRQQFESFSMEKKSIVSYKILLEEKNRAVYCHTCSEPCKGVCPFGIDIKPELLKAHKLLSLV